MTTPDRRILLVEDEPDVRSTLKELLETELEGVTVATASNGMDALRMLATLRPDIILSDYRMPGMDGLAFLEASRASVPDAPKILMTAFPDMELALKAINDAHIENFIQKPFDPQVMIQKLDRILAMQTARRTQEQALAKSIAELRARLADVEHKP